MLGSTSRDFHTTTVVRCACTFEDTGNLTELTAHLLYHLLCCTTYSLHRHTTEQESGHRTNEGTNDHARVHEVDLEVVHEVGDSSVGSRDHVACHIRQGLSGTSHRDLDLLDIRGKEGKGGEGSRTDGKALTCSGSGVTKCIKRVGTMTNLFAQSAHFGITTGIVGDRSISVSGEGDTQCREHTDGSNTDAIETMRQ